MKIQQGPFLNISTLLKRITWTYWHRTSLKIYFEVMINIITSHWCQFRSFQQHRRSLPASVEVRRLADSSWQLITAQREAVVMEALMRHRDQSARLVLAYPQLDKLSMAWNLSLPGITNDLAIPIETRWSHSTSAFPVQPANRSLISRWAPRGQWWDPSLMSWWQLPCCKTRGPDMTLWKWPFLICVMRLLSFSRPIHLHLCLISIYMSIFNNKLLVWGTKLKKNNIL